MECNVLGSGPRRNLFLGSSLTSIGCNIPWTKVNFSFIFDTQVAQFLDKNINMVDPETKFVLHTRVLVDCRESKLRTILSRSIAELEEVLYNTRYRRSSLHYAAMYMISLGYTKLNIYGCDSWFDVTNYLDSYTDIFMDKPQNMPARIGVHWRDEWIKMKKQHAKVEFNFI